MTDGSDEIEENENEALIEEAIMREEERGIQLLRDIRMYERELLLKTEQYNELGRKLSELDSYHRNIIMLASELITNAEVAMEMRRIGLGDDGESTETTPASSETDVKVGNKENTLRSTNDSKHLYVALNRLPESVMRKHTISTKQALDCSTEIHEPIEGNTPTYTSTPLDVKTRALREIYGLTPVKELRNREPTQPSPPFDNTRRKTFIKYSIKTETTTCRASSNRNEHTAEEVSPEKTERKRSTIDSAACAEAKRLKLSPTSPVVRTRRRARPQNMKEQSLKNKIRRQ